MIARLGKKGVSLETRLAEAILRQSSDAMMLLSEGRFIAGNVAEKVYGRPSEIHAGEWVNRRCGMALPVSSG